MSALPPRASAHSRAAARAQSPAAARAVARAALAALAMASLPAWAAGYPRSGGQLRIAAATLPSAAGDPTLADSPAEAALRSLEVSAACRVSERDTVEPLLALGWEESDRPSLRMKFASPELAQAQAQAWSPGPAALVSPYRALLFPLREVSAQGADVRLNLSFPWPDLSASLCHPALSLRRTRLPASGPYLRRKQDTFEAQAAFPSGRPYPDQADWRGGGERAAQRQFALGEAEIWLGGIGDAPVTSHAPLLYATYLAFRPGAVGPDFRRALESAVDRSDLARYFVRAPAAPLAALLPPPLLPLEGLPSPVLAPPPLAVPHSVELLLDESLPDQRAVAERLQVKLHDLGYRVSLKPMARATLRQRWAKGDFEAMLHSVLLPPQPAPALAVVLDLAGRRDLLPLELPALGALEAGPRAERVKARAAFLAPSLSLVPLYVQGLSVVLSPAVHGLTWDAQGLPRLDGVWLAP